VGVCAWILLCRQSNRRPGRRDAGTNTDASTAEERVQYDAERGEREMATEANGGENPAGLGQEQGRELDVHELSAIAEPAAAAKGGERIR
jgi:hypothetical protein